MPESYDIHAKILRSGQYVIEQKPYLVKAPKIFKKTKEQEIDESTQRIEELQDEIKVLESDIIVKAEKSEKDAEEIMDKAESEAERIVKNAERSAFDRVKKSLTDKEKVIEEKAGEAEKILLEAKKETDFIIDEAKKEAENIKDEARKEGFTAGRERGFEFAKEEVVHMVDRLKSIIRAMIDERERIMIHSEQQIINLVLTMVAKIVKQLTEDEKNVVINNVSAALKLIHGSTKVYIRVNPDDYKFTLQHREELIKLIEGMPEVKFFEDPTIGKGGVYIETDVGDIDATIATQLEEIQNKIKFYMPVLVTTKAKEDKVKAEAGIKEEKSLEEEFAKAETVTSDTIGAGNAVPDLKKSVSQKDA